MRDPVLLQRDFNAFGFWPVADFIKTCGRGYMISDGDGVAYSYSVFNDYDQISALCKRIHLMRDQGQTCTARRPTLHCWV